MVSGEGRLVHHFFFLLDEYKKKFLVKNYREKITLIFVRAMQSIMLRTAFFLG